jgi:hypothetical protein
MILGTRTGGGEVRVAHLRETGGTVPLHGHVVETIGIDGVNGHRRISLQKMLAKVEVRRTCQVRGRPPDEAVKVLDLPQIC